MLWKVSESFAICLSPFAQNIIFKLNKKTKEYGNKRILPRNREN